MQYIHDTIHVHVANVGVKIYKYSFSFFSQKRRSSNCIMETLPYDNAIELTEENIGSETNTLVAKRFKPTQDNKYEFINSY